MDPPEVYYFSRHIQGLSPFLSGVALIINVFVLFDSMWVLISKKNEDERFQLLVGEEYVVGRKDCHILVQNDQSISRKHATLKVSCPDTNHAQPQRPPILTVTDESRFGTLIRGEKLKPKEQRNLKNGDSVKFGTVDSIFQAIYEPFLVTTSCLDPPAKRQTKALMAQLGGHVVSEWRKDCQQLVMSTLSVTVKVICALVSQKPIVTPQYLVDWVKAIQTKTKLPSPDDYIPPLAESQLNPEEVSFKSDMQRKNLFEGKVFLFLSQKQFNKLNLPIELAGGTPILMEEGADDNEDDIILTKTTCVMACDAADASQNLTQNAQDWINHVMTLLKKHKRRPIQDPELGYAVLYCSTEKYCNPMAAPDAGGDHLPSQTLSQQPLASLSQGDVLAAHTEQDLPRSRPRNVSGLSVIQASQSMQGHQDRQMQDDQQDLKAEPVVLTVKSEVNSQNGDLAASTARNSKTKNQSAAKSKTITSFFGRKRPRGSDDDSSVASEAPPLKKSPFSFTSQEDIVPIAPIKVEKSTPLKHKSKDDVIDLEVEEVPSGRLTRTRNTPAETSRKTVKRENRDDGSSERNVKVEPSEDLFDFGARKNRISQRARSPSPTREAADDEDDLFDFGARRNRKSQKTKSPSPKPRQIASSPNPEVNVVEEDPFDVGVRRSSRRKSRSPSPAPDVQSTVGKHSPRHQHRPETNNNTRKRSRSSRSPSPAPSRDLEMEHMKESSTPKGKGKGKNKKSAVENILKVEDSEEESGTALPSVDGDGSIHPGYLTAIKPIQDQVCSINLDYVKDENLPMNCIQTEFKSLVVRKPSGARAAAKTGGDSNIWKGKPVKNFKKFRKSQYAGMAGLPQIIGRTDLMVHMNQAGREVESWFQDEAQAESQQNERDKMAQDLFDYVPAKKRKASRR